MVHSQETVGSASWLILSQADLCEEEIGQGVEAGACLWKRSQAQPIHDPQREKPG